MSPNGGINKIYYVRVMDAEVIDLFPSTVLKFKNKDQEIFDELEECVKAIEQNENLTLHTGVNIPNDQSWLHFFGNYRLPKLNKFISDGIDTYVGNDEWQLWSSWLNIYPKGSNQDKHLHAGYDLSACYYHCTSPEQGLINFHSPLRESQLDCYGTYQQMAVPTESGTLIIFPSWLEHSTTPNESDLFKISIGMNIKVTKSGERPFLGQSYGKHTVIHKYNGI